MYCLCFIYVNILYFFSAVLYVNMHIHYLVIYFCIILCRKSICTSINHVVCHGIPDDKPLREGDILNIDVTLIVEGWHGDSSRMYVAGEAPRRAQRLIDVTYDCLMRGIDAVRPGATTGDIGARDPELRRARAMLGGARFLRPWPRPAVSRRAQYPALRAQGRRRAVAPRHVLHHRADDQSRPPGVKVLSDGWTAVTRDRSLSAQFEHTVGVTETGVEIFTLSPRGWDRPPYPQ